MKTSVPRLHPWVSFQFFHLVSGAILFSRYHRSVAVAFTRKNAVTPAPQPITLSHPVTMYYCNDVYEWVRNFFDDLVKLSACSVRLRNRITERYSYRCQLSSTNKRTCGHRGCVLQTTTVASVFAINLHRRYIYRAPEPFIKNKIKKNNRHGRVFQIPTKRLY